MQTEAEVRDLAWVGDAVLGLYAREYILTHPLPGQFSRHELYEPVSYTHLTLPTKRIV